MAQLALTAERFDGRTAKSIPTIPGDTVDKLSGVGSVTAEDLMGAGATTIPQLAYGYLNGVEAIHEAMRGTKPLQAWIGSEAKSIQPHLGWCEPEEIGQIPAVAFARSLNLLHSSCVDDTIQDAETDSLSVSDIDFTNGYLANAEHTFGYVFDRELTKNRLEFLDSIETSPTSGEEATVHKKEVYAFTAEGQDQTTYVNKEYLDEAVAMLDRGSVEDCLDNVRMGSDTSMPVILEDTYGEFIIAPTIPP